MVDPNSQIRLSGCSQFSDLEVEAVVSGDLDEASADLFFEHLADCPACQLRMMEKQGAFAADRLPLLPGDDENEADVRSFVARIELEPFSVVEYEPGDDVDHYQVVSRIGKGATSVVYLCLDTQIDRQIALKVIAQPAYFRKHQARHVREARILARLDHAWIVKAHEIKPFHFPPYIVMEFVPGGPSGLLLKKGPLAPRVAARLVEGVARAVHHAHEKGVLHRDIKPSNLLVVESFDPEREIPDNLTLKVSDFGLARPIAADSGLTSTHDIVGTPAYMSPEQVAGNPKLLGPQSDIYSIGAVLYEYLIGRPPLLGENAMATLGLIKDVEPVAPRQIRPGIPRDLETICLKCLRKNPADRYPTAEALADDLQRYLEDRPILARPISLAHRLYRWARRNQWLAASLSALQLTMIAIVVLALRVAFVQNQRRLDAENLLAFTKKVAEEAALDHAEIVFLDRLPFIGFHYEPEAYKRVEQVLQQALQSKPDSPLHKGWISLGNRVSSALAKRKLQLHDQKAALEILLQANDKFRLESEFGDFSRIQILERCFMLQQMMGALDQTQSTSLREAAQTELAELKARLEKQNQ